MRNVQFASFRSTSYYATNKGEVVNKQGRPLKGGKTNGYVALCLRINNQNKQMLKHRVIYEAFNGQIPLGMEVHFIDGNKNNCNINNLTLKSHKEIMNTDVVKAKISVPKCVNTIKYERIE